MNEVFVNNVWEAVVYLSFFSLVGWIVYLSVRDKRKRGTDDVSE